MFGLEGFALAGVLVVGVYRLGEGGRTLGRGPGAVVEKGEV